MHPGDEIYVKDALSVRAGKRRARVEFIAGETLRVRGAYEVRRNLFEIPSGAGHELRIGLQFSLAREARMNVRKEIVVLVTERYVVKWRAATVVALMVLALAPAVIRLSEILVGTQVNVGVSIGDSIVFAIPAAFVVTLATAIGRVREMVGSLWSDLHRFEFVAETDAHIGVAVLEASEERQITVVEWRDGGGEDGA